MAELTNERIEELIELYSETADNEWESDAAAGLRELISLRKQKPESVSPEWIARAAEECAHEILDESYKMGTTVKAKKMCHDIDIAWIGTDRIKAIIQAVIERNSK